MFYQYVKESFVVPSTDAIKNLRMSQKNSVKPKVFYPNILLTSTSLSLNTQQQEIIFTDKKLQLSYFDIQRKCH